MRVRMLGMLLLVGGRGVWGQTLPAPASTSSQPASAPATRKAVDRSTPRAAMEAYFQAWRAISVADVNDATVVSDPKMRQYADIVLNWMAWTRYLERAAVKKFGRDAALGITGRLRTADEQLDLDQKRLPAASIDYAPDHASATLFLRVEPGRPDGLQVDRFSFLDRYFLVHSPDGWRVDFLKTYDCQDPDKDALYRFEARMYPLLATALKELSDKLAAGDFATPAALKAELDARTEASYSGSSTGKAAPTAPAGRSGP